MPGSVDTFNKEIENFIKLNTMDSILDIGPGSGKYGKMASAAIPHCKRIAVEAFEKYIDMFKLNDIYHEVHCSTLQDYVDSHMNDVYGTVIMGDVIEHLPKSQGIDYLHKLSYMCHSMVVVYPHDSRQLAEGGNQFERHISRWCEDDFKAFNSATHYRRGNTSVVFIKNVFHLHDANRGNIVKL